MANVAQLLNSRFPRATSRMFVLAVFFAYAVTSAFAGYAQVHWSGWFFVGHSYVAWICVTIAAASRGSVKDSWITCAGGLILAIIIYYASWSLSEPQIVGQFYLPTVFKWCVLAMPAGLIVSLIGLWSLSGSSSAGMAVGLVIGLVWGDLLLTKGILTLASTGNFTAAATAVFRSWDALNWICVVFTLSYALIMTLKIRPRRLLFAAPAGLLLGWLVMTFTAGIALYLMRAY